VRQSSGAFPSHPTDPLKKTSCPWRQSRSSNQCNNDEAFVRQPSKRRLSSAGTGLHLIVKTFMKNRSLGRSARLGSATNEYHRSRWPDSLFRTGPEHLFLAFLPRPLASKPRAIDIQCAACEAWAPRRFGLFAGARKVVASWSAPAERCGDGAFFPRRTSHQSSVALSSAMDVPQSGVARCLPQQVAQTRGAYRFPGGRPLTQPQREDLLSNSATYVVLSGSNLAGPIAFPRSKSKLPCPRNSESRTKQG
jgi:hypothetical protein